VNSKFFSNKNTVISIVSSSMVALAIIFASKMPGASIIETMLFGDIFSFTNKDLYLLAVLDIIILILLFKFLRHIVLISLNTDLARVQKISVNIIELSILLILAIVVTVTVKTIGALLITALLVIPAATARMISTTPINMIIYSIIIALLSGMFGVYISFQLDWPLASAVALASVALYSATACVKFTKQQRQI
jgi:zinc transport system permease protein